MFIQEAAVQVQVLLGDVIWTNSPSDWSPMKRRDPPSVSSSGASKACKIEIKNICHPLDSSGTCTYLTLPHNNCLVGIGST